MLITRLLAFLVLSVTLTGCFAERSFSRRKIRVFDEVRNISLKDSTTIFINTPPVLKRSPLPPLKIKQDVQSNTLVIFSDRNMVIRKIPMDQVNSVFVKKFSSGASSGLGWLLG